MKIETMTLTDFLLARIAEDEDAAQYGAEATVGAWGGDRVLAECEAKRRIVEEYLEAAEETGDGLGIRLTGDAGIGLQRAVQLLALLYADHPDYREEWRP